VFHYAKVKSPNKDINNSIMSTHLTTSAEENYLKAIFKIAEKEPGPVLTNALAAEMGTSAASATDMLKRLSDKQLVAYEKYRGVTLSEAGSRIATDAHPQAQALGSLPGGQTRLRLGRGT
jgi:DNA-binding MarR family transcriptional regulator